jgi:hypothetical protein
MVRVALAVAAVLAPGYAIAEGQSAATKPQLRVVATQPLAVMGTGFRPGEKVRVSAHTDDGDGSRLGTAGRAGRLGMRFPSLSLDRCATYLITARGSKGSRATVRSVPPPCGSDQ